MIMNMTLNKYLDNLVWISIFFYYFTLVFLSQFIPGGGGRYVLLGSMLIMLVCAFLRRAEHFKLQFPLYLVYIALFTFYTFLTGLWALDASWSIYWGKDFFVLLIMMTVLIHCLPTKNTTDNLLQIVMFSGYATILCAIAIYGWGYISMILSNSDRVENGVLNANDLGLAAAYSILINFYFVYFHKKKYYCVPISLLSFVILAASGSRKALAMLVLGCFFLIVLKNISNKEIMNSILKIVVLVIVLIIAVYFLIKLPIMSGISKRMEGLINMVTGKGKVDLSTLGRMKLIRLGKKIFKSSPIVGIGMDNSKIIALKEMHRKNFYLHNNFIEMLADGGIIGFIAYYWIYVYLIAVFFKYRNFQSSEYNICVTLFLLNLAMDMGMVSYLYKSTYFYLLISYYAAMNVRNQHNQPTLQSMFRIGANLQ